ncbi:MAG: hypothetical protein J6Y20_07125 [Lachnospiraceae bacterium]|nr:hypothetical protein [Lachnospiraceae bacterium]
MVTPTSFSQPTTAGPVCQYAGISTDTKPTTNVLNGSMFIEMDTSKIYFFDQQNKLWREWGGENA